MTLKGLVLRLRRAFRAFLSDGVVNHVGPYVPNPTRVIGLTPDLAIQPTARLIVDEGAPDAAGRIVLGRGIYLGRFAEVATTDEGVLSIGDDTSIQDYSVIIGDVTLGCHCALAPNVHITSSTHHFRYRAPWLIRDQDREVLNERVRLGTRTWPVTIEDDCWIGWCVVILPGVYIGRGAVIGANSVVSRDVPPYEVHTGAPNRCTGKRLEFSPGKRIDALDDHFLPYFYRGFHLSQQSLARSRALGVINARRNACLVLARIRRAKLRLVGRRLDADGDLLLKFQINGADCGTWRINDQNFTIDIAIPDQESTVQVPAVLRNYTYVEIHCGERADGSRAGADGARYGIGAAYLLPQGDAVDQVNADGSFAA